MDHINTIGYIAAFCTTFSFLPQALLTIKTKNTDGISLSMYSMFTFGISFWLVYGILKQDYILITANSITLFFAIIIFTYKLKSVLKAKKS